MISECVFKSCLLSSISSGLLVIPGVSTLPCLPLILSLKTIILKYFLVCVFLVSPCCVHRDRRPDLDSKRRPFTSFCFVRFFKCFICSRVLSLAASESARRETSCSRFAGVYAAVRGSPIRGFAGLHARRSREFTPPFAALPSRCSREFSPPFAAQPSRRSRELSPRSRLCHPAVCGSSCRRFADHPALSSRG